MQSSMRPLDASDNPTRWVRRIDTDIYEIIEINSNSKNSIDGTRLSQEEINRLAKLAEQ